MRVVLAQGQAWQRSALRLLLDNTPNVEVVAELADVAHVPCATSALQPDVILIDWMLPGLKSNSARQRLFTSLHALHPGLCVLVLLGIDVAMSVLHATGADAYVSKTQPPDRLLAILQCIASNHETDHVPHAATRDKEMYDG